MTMKKIQVSTATNNQLDWLVAKCERDTGADWTAHNGRRYTTDPAQMWPIIDANTEMQFWPWGGSPDERNGELQCACLPSKLEGGTRMRTWFGKTKLIAAARCYVASKLGETVEVPEELT